jgi:hypothetical protein
MLCRIGFVLLAPAVAHADHDHMAMAAHGDDSASTFDASVSLLAASFSTTFYAGNYEGVTPSVGWSMGRFAAGASLPYYRLYENGLSTFGLGDFVVHGQAALLQTHDVQLGGLLGVSAPTGNPDVGLGMGHVMIMPAAWGAWKHDGVVVTATAGYSRAVIDDSSHHDHGMWPLVEPMNMSEITWSGAGEVAIGEGVRAGARLSGGVPVGALPGHDRMIAAARVAWGTGRVDTAAEIQAGLVGDPFTLRGVVSTALRF